MNRHLISLGDNCIVIIVINILTLTNLFHILVKFIVKCKKDHHESSFDIQVGMKHRGFWGGGRTPCHELPELCLAIPPQVLPVALPVPTKAPSRQVSQEVRVEPPVACKKAPMFIVTFASSGNGYLFEKVQPSLCLQACHISR